MKNGIAVAYAPSAPYYNRLAVVENGLLTKNLALASSDITDFTFTYSGETLNCKSNLSGAAWNAQLVICK